MANRDASLYGLLTSQPVAVMSKLHISDPGIQLIEFSVFGSKADFVGNKVRPIDELRISLSRNQPDGFLPKRAASYILTDDDLAPYIDIVESIKEKALDVLGYGGRGYKLVTFLISTLDKTMTISAVSPKGGHEPADNWSAEDYDDILAANSDLVTQALPVAIALGMTKDPFLASMTPVN